MDRNPSANAGNTGSIPGPGRFHMPQGNCGNTGNTGNRSITTTEAYAPSWCPATKSSTHLSQLEKVTCGNVHQVQPNINKFLKIFP